VLVSIVSGVLSTKWAHSPITWLRKEALARRRLAGGAQIIQQLLFPGRLWISPSVSFATPITTADLGGEDSSSGILRPLIERARTLLAEHMT
jgi:hypothetical protein